MPKRAPELSETDLKRLLKGFNLDKAKGGPGGLRTKRASVALGVPAGVFIRLNPGKAASAPVYLTLRTDKNGPVRWLPLGFYPEMSLAEIHAAASAARQKNDKGADPIEEARAEKAATKAAAAAAKAEALRLAKEKSDAPTMKDAADLYAPFAQKHRDKVKESTEKWATGLIQRTILPFWAERKVAEVTRKEVKEWHEGLLTAPFQADASIRVLSRIFNLAIDEGWRPDNPAKGIVKKVRGAKNVRHRTLDQAERKALSRTLNTMSLDPAPAGAIRALLLSAMRKEECLTLRWDEITWDEPTTNPETGEVAEAITGWIEKADHKSSNSSGVKLIAITPQLGQLLRAQPTRKGCPWVFPSPITPRPGKEVGHFIGIQKVWDRVREQVTKDEATLVADKKKKPSEAVNIEDVHLHDLRRTALSITYADEGQTIEGLAEVAGHASTATTKKHYAHLDRDKKRKAATLIANAMAADMEGK